MSATPPTVPWQPSALQLDRIAYRRRRARRSVAISLVVTVVVLAVVATVVHGSSGWPRFRDSFLDVGAGARALPGMLEALWLNVQIMLIAEVAILVGATLLALMRTLPGPAFFPLRFFAALYTDLFRGMPVLVVLLLVAYGIPSLRLAGVTNSGFVWCTVALSLTYSAYVAEVLRAGVQSVHPSQTAAARSLGLSYARTMRHVVFPQAVRRVIPPLLNDFVSLQKDTSLVSTVGLSEIVLTAQNDGYKDFKFVYYVVAGLVFVALTIPLTRLTDWISARQGWAGTTGAIR